MHIVFVNFDLIFHFETIKLPPYNNTCIACYGLHSPFNSFNSKAKMLYPRVFLKFNLKYTLFDWLAEKYFVKYCQQYILLISDSC